MKAKRGFLWQHSGAPKPVDIIEAGQEDLTKKPEIPGASWGGLVGKLKEQMDRKHSRKQDFLNKLRMGKGEKGKSWKK